MRETAFFWQFQITRSNTPLIFDNLWNFYSTCARNGGKENQRSKIFCINVNLKNSIDSHVLSLRWLQNHVLCISTLWSSSLVHGGWGDWGTWSGCSVTCGIGASRRIRKCDNPRPKYGGTPCNPAQGVESRSCDTYKDCPGKDSETNIAFLAQLSLLRYQTFLNK
jgi:hypothetical protein